jgi:hypothetical protein
VTVTVSGIAAGYAVTLYDGSRAIASAASVAAGSWTVTVNLAVGLHSLSATQTSPTIDGRRWTSDASAARPVAVYAPPPPPTISSAPVNVGTGTPFTISGRGVAGATVTLTDNGIALALPPIVVRSDGTWSATLALATTGSHVIRALQLDGVSGFASGLSSSWTIGVFVPPPAPVVTGATTPAATRSTSPVTVSGTGVQGDTVTLYDGGVAIATVRITSASGAWSLTVSLAIDTHVLTATQTLVAGVPSAASNAVTVVVPRR